MFYAFQENIIMFLSENYCACMACSCLHVGVKDGFAYMQHLNFTYNLFDLLTKIRDRTEHVTRK